VPGRNSRRVERGASCPGREQGLQQVGLVADLFGGAHGVEHLCHDFSRTSTTDIVHGLELEQLGAREDDPQLVVQAVEEDTEVPPGLKRRVRGGRGLPELAHACEPVGRTVALT